MGEDGGLGEGDVALWQNDQRIPSSLHQVSFSFARNQGRREPITCLAAVLHRWRPSPAQPMRREID